ncbi:BatD family protein [Neolewinella lacunae]|uniref:Protein BatD n=1 Tax=Neolewinella lacunae TaxID=1517758 RepID=A0A923PLP0_9BACT|nr:BatD family protein [Neolewinella lacunae]MBC6992797.1 protein BatD [Neolewinella lacunae]MDN3636041.1 BatD family protein [Neolewinella lacunae]
MWRNLALLFFLCTCGRAQVALAQHQDIDFSAEVSKARTFINSTVEYSLVLRNAQGTDLVPPAFRDFIVLRGPSRAMGTTIINGVGSSHLTHSWLLQPKRVGELTIETATIVAAGRTYRANSKTVEVLPVDAGAAALAPDDFLRAELSTDTAYVGQQIILDLNLYSTTNVISRNLMQEPDFAGFFSQPRRQYDGRPRTVIENGREYQRRTLGSLALFPTKSGRIRIDPYRMVLGTVRYRNSSTFSRRFTEQIPLNTDTLYVEVKELPQPRPADFSGAVGSYRLDVQADRDQLTTDDALTLRIIVTGEGDIERLDAFPPVSDKDWDIYDPVILQEELLDSPSGMLGRKIFEYKVVPKRAGQYDLRPGLTYFDVDSNRYVTNAPAVFPITVTGGTGQATYEIDTLSEEAAKLVLLPVRDLPAGRSYGSATASRFYYWLLFLLPLLGAGGALAWQAYRARQAGRDPAEVARARAAQAATQRLKGAKVHLDAVAPRPFYDAVEGALFGYLRDRFNLSVAKLNRRNVSATLRDAGADAALAERYDRLLQRCEMALYAGQDQADDLADTYRAARELIVDTERQVE